MSKELDRKLVHKEGSFERWRIWYKGHSHLYPNIQGWTGVEHFREITVIKAKKIYERKKTL